MMAKDVRVLLAAVVFLTQLIASECTVGLSGPGTKPTAVETDTIYRPDAPTRSKFPSPKPSSTAKPLTAKPRSTTKTYPIAKPTPAAKITAQLQPAPIYRPAVPNTSSVPAKGPSPERFPIFRKSRPRTSVFATRSSSTELDNRKSGAAPRSLPTGSSGGSISKTQNRGLEEKSDSGEDGMDSNEKSYSTQRQGLKCPIKRAILSPIAFVWKLGKYFKRAVGRFYGLTVER